MKPTSKKRTPSLVNLTVKRRYLTEREVDRLMDCARKYGRYGHRDATMILVAYRHGLRASEVCDLQWQQIELSEGRLHVHRVKNGIPSVHPIRGDEMRALRKLRRDYPKDAYVFVSERGGPISPIGFHRLIQRVGEAAKMPFPIHPHMLRHACRFKLANDGHDTRALQHYFVGLAGTGKLGTTSASPSITFAVWPARAANIALIAAMASSICSSLIALTPPECSTFISCGTSSAQTFKYAAGDS